MGENRTNGPQTPDPGTSSDAAPPNGQPARSEEPDAPPSEETAHRLLRALRLFFVTGRRPARAGPAVPAPRWTPAPLSLGDEGTTPDPFSLLREAWPAERDERTQAFRDDLDALLNGLSDILAVDAGYAPEAVQPDHLKPALGDDIDAEALSHLLQEHPLGNPLPAARRARIRKAYATLQSARGLLSAVEDEPATSCEAALARATERARAWVDAARAAHIARLELDNAYREAQHDPLFAQYGWVDLTDGERALCPPVFVHLNGPALREADKDLLVDLLESRLPVKMLVTLDRACDPPRRPFGAACAFGWPARLATMALTLRSAYVLQAPASDGAFLREGFRDGLRYGGPALFCVYTGDEADTPHLSPYARAALAAEARAVPAFAYDPGQGIDRAARFDCTANPQAERDWPVQPAPPPQADDGRDDAERLLSFADFLACDARFAPHFLPLEQVPAPDLLVPLGSYLQLDEDARADRLPYLLLAEEGGAPRRVLVTRAVVQATQQALDYWRSIQELGGLRNAYAEALMAQMEARHQDELRTLAQQIVSRLAARLLDLPASDLPAPFPLPAEPDAEAPAEAPEPAAEPPEPGEEAPEEEAPLSFDEAYIETPRCTSCNDCLNINPRLFAYDENMQAYIKDVTAGTYRELVMAAEKCPVAIIHPGRPVNPDEPGLDELLERAKPFL